MSRPLRIEFAGALYHVTSRGDGREVIFLGDEDRHGFLEVLSELVHDFNWAVHAYCLMDNHYHLLIEIPDSNPSKGMRQLGTGSLFGSQSDRSPHGSHFRPMPWSSYRATAGLCESAALADDRLALGGLF